MHTATDSRAIIGRDAERVGLIQRRVLRWYRTNGRDFPWRYQQDPWHVLLAELLLQRTRADLVVPVYGRVLELWPTAGSLADAPSDRVMRVLNPLGFVHRNERIQAAAAACRSGVPEDIETLRAIHGVGRYVATATAVFAYGYRAAVVDPTIIRLIERLGLATSERNRPRDDPRMWATAEALLPTRDPRTWNYALLDFGAN